MAFETEKGPKGTFAMRLVVLLMIAIVAGAQTFPSTTPPSVIKRVDPEYSKEARDAKIEGTVGLTVIVGTDQRAHDIRVTRSLDPGLDASAIRSIMSWRFQPATKNGKPVPVVAKIDVNFRLL